MAKAVLITGASGLLGAYIARKLLADGYKVHAIKRENSALNLLGEITDNIQWHIADILDVVALKSIFESDSFDYVIHAAAMVSYHPRDKDAMDKVNIEGTANIVNLCLRHNKQKLVHISSIAAIGKENENTLLHENSKRENFKFESNYGSSKYLAELEAWRAFAEGLPTVILNPSVIIGPGNWEKSSTQLFNYVRKGKKFYTRGLLNYVDVRDVAQLACESLSPEKQGQYILNAGHLTYRQAFADIATHFGMKAPNIGVKPSLVLAAARIDSLWSRLWGKKPLIPIETARLGKSPYQYDNSKVKKDFAITFKTWDESVRWCCNALNAAE